MAPAMARIRYTIDGSEPSDNSQIYTSPLLFSESAVLKIQAVAPDSDPGIVISYNIRKADLLDPLMISDTTPGLFFDYYERFFVTTEDIDLVDPVRSGIISSFTLDNKEKESYFGFRYSGLIKVPSDGLYTFFLKSNDGSRMFIDGRELIENDGNHGAVEEPGKVALKAGMHRIMVKYIQCGGGKSLTVSWEGPGFKKCEISSKDLYIETKL